jgi:hypothetical protein
VLYATDYLRQRVRSLAQDALQRKDLSAHEHWISVLRPAKKISTDNTIKKCVP